MRIKIVLAVPGPGSLACTANVSVLQPSATVIPQDIPPGYVESTRFQFLETQAGWVVLSDALSHTSLYKTTDGGQTWAA